MYRIMFVCLGNICRSPMAEMVFSWLVKSNGLENEFKISSSAVSSEEIINGRGNPVYPPAKAELLRHGIEIIPHNATLLTFSDYEKYDLFIGMEERNIYAMNRILKGDREGKIKKLLDFTPRGGDVADPWYTDRFDIAYNDIYEGCKGLLAYLKNGLNNGKNQ